MSYSKYSPYSLDIISHHPQFNGKYLKKYKVDDIPTIGAWGNEPFEIKFKNNTHNKIQVKISIDGTDVLTGKPASTDLESGMWVVYGYGTLSLKAWPETNNGGAGFVFTSADNSVALHTHGNLDHRGIIAVAIYEEGYVEPVRLYFNGDQNYDSISGSSVKSDSRRFKKSLLSSDAGPITQQSLSFNSCSTDADSVSYNSTGTESMKNLESLVSVGAGDHVNQKITYVSGLIKPKFVETIRVRYLWWDDLVSKLKEQTPSDVHPSGFPGDKEHKIMDLKGTPKIKLQKKQARPEPVFSRF